MDRQEYNACMSPYITGKKPVEQRRLDFCIGAKVCSGKSSTPEEAKKICLSTPPKEPKARKSRKRPEGCPPCPPCNGEKPPVAENLSCPQRQTRVINTIEGIIDKAKAGDATGALSDGDLVLKDVAACHPEEAVILAREARDFLKQLGKDYYFKSEIQELKDHYNTLKVLIGG